MKWLEVIHPGGVQSTVQDSGRRGGYRHHGLAAGGALDLVSYAWANKLLNNPRHAACLEIMLGGDSAPLPTARSRLPSPAPEPAWP